MRLEVAFQLLPCDDGHLGLPGRGTTAHIPGEHYSGQSSVGLILEMGYIPSSNYKSI